MNQREKILHEAQNLFQTKGYDRTGIRDIARACHCRQSNLYNYFTSKEQILYEIISSELTNLISNLKHLEDNGKANPVEQLKAFIRIHLNHEVGSGRANRILFDTEMKHMSNRYRRKIIELRDTYDMILRKILRRGRDAGVFGELNEKIVNYIIASTVMRTRLWFSAKGELSLSEIGDEIFKCVLYGIKSGNSGNK